MVEITRVVREKVMLFRTIKILAVAFLITSIFLGGLFFLSGYLFYKNVFRLSYEQIVLSLEKTASTCQKFSECALVPGDILIRRYVTNTSDLFSKYLNPYFTHSAMYLGQDEVFEALGNTETPENQIKISKLSESDWFDEKMKNFVVVRPINISDKLYRIDSRLRDIANDPEYVFGLFDETKKSASCSDVILKQLVKEKIVKNSSNLPWAITPDYLFWIAINNSRDFEVVGYNVSQK